MRKKDRGPTPREDAKVLNKLSRADWRKRFGGELQSWYAWYVRQCSSFSRRELRAIIESAARS